MNAVRYALAVVVVFGLTATVWAEEAKPTKEQLVGTWAVTKVEGKDKAPKLTTTFTRDNKVINSFKYTPKGGTEEKEIREEGTYKLEGDKLLITMTRGGKERTVTEKIKTLTDKELVLVGAKQTITFKKVRR